MLLSVLLKGILLGVAIAAPVGPIAILCVRRTLTQGRWVGLLSGLGAATADGLYGLVAAFGLSTLSNLLVNNATYLQVIGGTFLCYLGLKTFLAKLSLSDTDLNKLPVSTGSLPNLTTGQSHGNVLPTPLPLATLTRAYSSTLVLTLTNPATILSFVAIFAGLDITQTHPVKSMTLVAGVFTGSSGWWLVLVSGVAYLRNRLTSRQLACFNQWATKVLGVVLLGFGIVAFVAS